MIALFQLPGNIRLGQLVVSTVICVLTWFLVLLLHAYQHRKNGFSISIWMAERKTTFAVGLSVTLLIALLRAFTKDMAQLLSLLGFVSGPSAAISLGLAIAALLLGFKPSAEKKNGETGSEVKN